MRLATPLLLALLAACPASTPDHPTPTPPDDSPLRIRIARAEARRGDGVDELVKLATDGTKAEKLLALRGLGRIGGPKALPVLIAALHEPPDLDVAVEAATALGLAVSLDEEIDEKLQIKLTDELAVLYRIVQITAQRVAIVEAIGRAAAKRSPSTLALGAALIHKDPLVAEAGGIALGRFGRRKITLDDATRDQVVVATKHADPRVRYAAAYALAREQLPAPAKDVKDPPADPHATAANDRLAELLADPDPNVRAIAAQALARRKAVADHELPLMGALHDADWKVAVEAARALGGDSGTARGREQVALAVLRWELGIANHQRRDYIRGRGPEEGRPFDPIEPILDPLLPNRSERDRLIIGSHITNWPETQYPVSTGDAHVVIEGLRVLAPHGKGETIRAVLTAIANNASKLTGLDRTWTECLAHVSLIRGANVPSYLELGENCKLPEHLELQLVGELVSAKVGTVGQRREALRLLLGHGDPRVRVAGMTALPTMWADGNDADHRAAAATVIAALGVKDGLVAGNAVDAATAIYEAGKNAGDWKDPLDAAVVARASTEKDAELAAALFELIGKQVITSGAAACKAGLGGAPVLAKAAASCLKALGQPVEVPAIGRASAPPVDIAAVIGKRVLWHLQTTRGEIVIELRPDIAPWAVATIATLTGKGFYDGLELHRVVPDFVAQGGDPTQSGWGGPGFALPAEPSTGAGYVQGGVGMADAGRDSAGSQWFIMHSYAPHLDGRYTWVGAVKSGQNSADGLQIGDRVLRATLEITARL